jgi:hypothetical protein
MYSFAPYSPIYGFGLNFEKNNRLRGITYENAVAFSVWRTPFPLTLARKV